MVYYIETWDKTSICMLYGFIGLLQEDIYYGCKESNKTDNDRA